MIQYNGLGAAQSEDLNVVLRLANELATVLRQNRAESNELIAFADTLDTDDDDETDSESITGGPTSSAPANNTTSLNKKGSSKSVNKNSSSKLSKHISREKSNGSNRLESSSSGSTAEQNGKHASNSSRMSTLLSRENASLRGQVADQRARNRALARLLILTQHTLDRCVDGLRTLVHSHTLESLDIHKRYIDTIHAEQRNSIEMELQNAELETRILQISKTLRDALRLTTVPYSSTTKPFGETKGYSFSDPSVVAENISQDLDILLEEKNTTTQPGTDVSNTSTSGLVQPSLLSSSTNDDDKEKKEFNQKYQTYLPVHSILSSSHIHVVPQDGKSWLETDGDVTKMPDYVMGMLESISTTSEQLKDTKSLLYKDLNNNLETDPSNEYSQYEDNESLVYGGQYS